MTDERDPKDPPPVHQIKRRTVDHGIYTEDQYSNAEDFEGEPVDAYVLIGDSPLPTILSYAAKEAQAERENPTNERAADEALFVECRIGEVEEALNNGDMERAAQKAFYLGESLERMRVKKVEHFARSEKNRREKATGRKPSLTDNEKRRVCELMREMFRNKLKKTPASKRVAALVAKEFGKEVSSKTIREYWNESGNK